MTWTYLDEPLKGQRQRRDRLDPNLHDAITYIDPVTGLVRLVFADDQGVFTALLNPDGTMNNGIGTDVAANYSRNGNLQDEQFYYGVAQSSNVAASGRRGCSLRLGRGPPGGPVRSQHPQQRQPHLERCRGARPVERGVRRGADLRPTPAITSSGPGRRGDRHRPDLGRDGLGRPGPARPVWPSSTSPRWAAT